MWEQMKDVVLTGVTIILNLTAFILPMGLEPAPWSLWKFTIGLYIVCLIWNMIIAHVDRRQCGKCKYKCWKNGKRTCGNEESDMYGWYMEYNDWCCEFKRKEEE